MVTESIIHAASIIKLYPIWVLLLIYKQPFNQKIRTLKP